jgi:hypothetical protein
LGQAGRVPWLILKRIKNCKNAPFVIYMAEDPRPRDALIYPLKGDRQFHEPMSD